MKTFIFLFRKCDILSLVYSLYGFEELEVTFLSKGVPNLGNTIRTLRVSRVLEQNELAELVGITQSHLSKIETGKANPSLRILRKIADALKVDAMNFFSGDTNTVLLDNETSVVNHLDEDIKKFIEREDSAPFLEFAKDIHEIGFNEAELDALRLIFKSRQIK